MKNNLKKLEELKESIMTLEHNWATIMKMSLDLICTASSDGHFLELSDSWVDSLGYSKDELKAKTFLEFVHPDDVQPTLDVMKSMHKEHVIKFKNRYKHKNGNWVTLCWNACSWIDGHVTYAIARVEN